MKPSQFLLLLLLVKNSIEDDNLVFSDDDDRNAVVIVAQTTTIPSEIDPRTFSRCECKPQGSCSKPQYPFNNYGDGIIDIRIVNQPSSNNVPCPLGYVFCCYQSQKIESCGTRNPIFRPTHSSDSKETYFGEFPWTAVLLGVGTNIYIGGGVVIDRSHIITAAHKIFTYIHGIGIKVRLGEWDASSNNELYPYQEYGIFKIDIHPDFDSSNLRNDIAIITLSEPIDFNLFPHISPICLPQLYSGQSEHSCWVSGWGKNAFGNDGNYQRIEKKVELSVLSGVDCQTKLRTTRLGNNFILDTNSFLCAGGEAGKDACTGDGGSPLVCDVSGRFEVIGLVSWGIGCAREGIPGVYVNIANYVPWIIQHLNT